MRTLGDGEPPDVAADWLSADALARLQDGDVAVAGIVQVERG